jgi:hypothetical protein
MKTELLVNSASVITKLKNAIQDGIDAWKQAGEALVELIDDHGMSLESICDFIGSPVVTINVLSQFERIGRNQVLPALLVADYPSAKLIQKLPISEQKRVSQGGVEVMVLRSGKADTLIVQAQDLTKDQCKQVFGNDSIRTLSAQRAWLESQAAEAQAAQMAAKASQVPWVIRNGKVIFRDSCELSRHDLSMILAQMA